MCGVASDFGLFTEQLIAPATEPMRDHAQLDTDKQRRDNRSDANAAQSVQEDQAGDERNNDHGHVKRDFDGLPVSVEMASIAPSPASGIMSAGT